LTLGLLTVKEICALSLNEFVRLCTRPRQCHKGKKTVLATYLSTSETSKKVFGHGVILDLSVVLLVLLELSLGLEGLTQDGI
jgi:hypothetical protein